MLHSCWCIFLFQVLTKVKLLPSFLLPSNHAYVELRVGVKRHVCFAYVVKSKTSSKQKRVIQPDQDVQVCGIFLVDSGWTPLDDLSLSLYIISWTWAIYIFFSFLFFFDMSCGHVAYLLWVCIFSLLFFSIVMPFGHVAYLLWVCIFYFFLYSPYPWW